MLIIQCDRCTEEFENDNIECPYCESIRIQLTDFAIDLGKEIGISVKVR